MNEIEKKVIIADDYDNIDGKNSNSGEAKAISLEFNEDGPFIVLDSGNDEIISMPIHQVLDIAIAACSSLDYFKNTYRFPKLYDEENPIFQKVGLQGDKMTLRICTENESIDDDVKELAQKLSDIDELLGERVRVLSGIINEME